MERSCLTFRVAVFVLSLWFLETAAAQTQIHKCADADGGVSYSQLPCPPPKVEQEEKPAPDTEAADDPVAPATPAPVAMEPPEEEPAPDSDRAACQKRYRDAIDAIDLEIGREYSADKADEYKRRLLELTRKLRRC